MGKLEGKNALVTGASTGIGRAIAVRFAEEGANVAINYRSEKDEAEKTLALAGNAAKGNGAGHRYLTIQADVAEEQQVSGMFATAVSELGDIDILVNNAGIQKPSTTEQIAVHPIAETAGVLDTYRSLNSSRLFQPSA